MMLPSGPEAATRLLNFINASPTPLHAVHNAALRLERAGFLKIKEKDEWELQAGGKYYFTRNQSALLAFTLPQKWQPGTGLSIVATHIDSPNLRVRPVSKRENVGYLQIGVETYGGGIWHTWLDRDLSLAGRVVLKHKDGFTSKLIKIEKPLLRIPTLAIHLDRNVNQSFSFNKETEFVPILGLIEAQLNATANNSEKSQNATAIPASSIQANHHSSLLALLASELSVAPEEVHDFELQLYDTQPSVLGGLKDEFIFSPRLDNQYSSFCAVESLASHANSQAFSTQEGNVNAIALFNHEEIGSLSTSGAKSNLIPTLIERLSPNPAARGQSIARSFLVSSDVTHAIHPNYTNKHESNHAPKINGGVAIKTNAAQSYASDSITSFLLKQLIERKGGKVQNYEVRNDMVCGSTVGPMLSSLGLRTVDVGCPILSMHSIRETGGAHDVQALIDLFTSLFEGFSGVDEVLRVD
ncbi:aspartyl aminopeptidase [Amylocystis lapponica]|nr:aspartyl aminopeptidase [Amylocystis lapponica]